VLSVTVHCPLAAKLTPSPDDAVALTAKSPSPNVLSTKAPNVIVWFPFAMLKLCDAGVAALYVELPF
jgi:hypothetical protein